MKRWRVQPWRKRCLHESVCMKKTKQTKQQQSLNTGFFSRRYIIFLCLPLGTILILLLCPCMHAFFLLFSPHPLYHFSLSATCTRDSARAFLPVSTSYFKTNSSWAYRNTSDICLYFQFLLRGNLSLVLAEILNRFYFRLIRWCKYLILYQNKWSTYGFKIPWKYMRVLLCKQRSNVWGNPWGN